MLNWDLHTHPQTDEFFVSHSTEEKRRLTSQWKEYMTERNIWISFYSWKKAKESEVILMTDSASSSGHSWTTIDGNKDETSTSFPPFKGIVLGEGQNSANAYPLVQK